MSTKVNGIKSITDLTESTAIDESSVILTDSTTNGPRKMTLGTLETESAFYGLAKAASDTTQSSSENVTGTYTDGAKQAILDMLGISDLIAINESDDISDQAYAIGDLFLMNSKLYRTTVAIALGDAIVIGTNCELVKLTDVMIKNTDYSSTTNAGIVKYSNSLGVIANGNNQLVLNKGNDTLLKAGENDEVAIRISNMHKATFYGLAKAAGDTTQAASDNAVGTYTDTAKNAIRNMIGAVNVETTVEEISGTDPVITANTNTRYMCGTLLSLDFTPSANGLCEVLFTSGSTLTVLTLPDTVKMPEWFEVEKNHIYEISIIDGVYGAVMSWPL